MKRRDLIVDETDELKIKNGDFVVDDADMQHVEHIIQVQKGEYKEFPLLGFGVQGYLKTNTPPFEFKRDLKIQLEYDGYKNANLSLTNDYQLSIEL